jgi:uncharacterized SAM-binding protein YcdF (DUF218 family)
MPEIKRNFIVVPEGLTADDSGLGSHVPSYIFRAVLDHVLKIAKPDDSILLSPGNRFGGSISEHEAARQYLGGRTEAQVHQPRVDNVTEGYYLDTRDNAVFLREYLESQAQWPLKEAVLVVGRLHSARARMIFEQEGYRLLSIESVPSKMPSNETLLRRLWYFRYPPCHFLYELLAGALFFFKLR